MGVVGLYQVQAKHKRSILKKYKVIITNHINR